MTIFSSIYRIVSIALFCIAFSQSFVNAENSSITQRVNGDSETTQKAGSCDLKRVSEIGGEVIIDGSMRVFEPIYTKISDYVEISTSVKPMSNHVRLYAVAVGTYSVLHVMFDDGQDKVLINN